MTLEHQPLPPVTEPDAERLARDFYGVEARARALSGELDDNFALTSRDGRAFVLKVMHPMREGKLVDLQVRALDHLARRAPRLTLPRVCLTLAGETVASVPLQNGEPRLVWMLTWVPGTVLARARPRSPELLVSLGRLLGEMDAALADFSHPAADRELTWDLTRAGWIRGFLHHLTDPSRRRLVER